MFGSEGLAIMLEGKKHAGTLEVFQRNIRGVALFGENQDEFRARLQSNAFQHVSEKHTPPVVVEATPASDTVKIAGHLRFRRGAKFVPRKAQRLFHQSANFEIPFRRVEVWHAARVQHRPLQSERLSRRQAAFRARQLLPLAPAAIITKNGHGSSLLRQLDSQAEKWIQKKFITRFAPTHWPVTQVTAVRGQRMLFFFHVGANSRWFEDSGAGLHRAEGRNRA